MKKTINIISVLVISIMSMIVLFSNNVFALEYTTNYGVNFTLNPSISVSLSSASSTNSDNPNNPSGSANLVITDLLPNTSSDSNTIIVNVASNNNSGYVLNSSVGNNTTYATNLDNLVNTASSSYKFTNLALNANLPSIDNSEDSNVWGYSYATYNTETSSWNNWSNYSGLPLYNNTNPAILYSTLTPSAEDGDNIRFKIAAKASSTQASGEYTNIINFIAVGNPEPAFCDLHTCLQDLTTSRCQINVGTGGNPANVGDNFTAYDRRDQKDYTVRYIDGACWMTQNLRITGTISAVDSNFTGTDFNVSAYDLKTDGASGKKCDSANGHNNACSHVPDVADLSAIGSSLTAAQIGVWYNYYAVTAGNIATNSDQSAAISDICPSGWHLPSGPGTTINTDFNKLVGNTTQTWQNPTTGLSAFGAIVGGGFVDGSLGTTMGNAYWWSANAKDDTFRYMLYYRSSDGKFYSSGWSDRYHGIYARCVRTN